MPTQSYDKGSTKPPKIDFIKEFLRCLVKLCVESKSTRPKDRLNIKFI